jgi:uncharacterized membrane protein YgcG
MDAYEIHEGRFIQQRTAASAVLGTTLNLGYPGPGAGKIWTVLAADYYPDISETAVISWQIVTRIGTSFTVKTPASLALNPLLNHYGLLEQGMELKLFPGEYLMVIRATAGAGSSMIGNVRFIETDLPYYSYEEPLKKIIAQSQKHSSVLRGGGGSSGGGRGSGGGGGGPIGGGGGVPKPI